MSGFSYWPLPELGDIEEALAELAKVRTPICTDYPQLPSPSTSYWIPADHAISSVTTDLWTVRPTIGQEAVGSERQVPELQETLPEPIVRKHSGTVGIQPVGDILAGALASAGLLIPTTHAAKQQRRSTKEIVLGGAEGRTATLKSGKLLIFLHGDEEGSLMNAEMVFSTQPYGRLTATKLEFCKLLAYLSSAGIEGDRGLCVKHPGRNHIPEINYRWYSTTLRSSFVRMFKQSTLYLRLVRLKHNGLFERCLCINEKALNKLTRKKSLFSKVLSCDVNEPMFVVSDL